MTSPYDRHLKVCLYASRFLQMGGTLRWQKIFFNMLSNLKSQPPVPYDPLAEKNMHEFNVSLPEEYVKRLNAYCLFRGVERSPIIRQCIKARLYKNNVSAPIMFSSSFRTPTYVFMLTRQDWEILQMELKRPSNFGLTASDLIRRMIMQLPKVEPPSGLGFYKCSLYMTAKKRGEDFFNLTRRMELRTADAIRSFVYLACQHDDPDFEDPLLPYLASFFDKPLLSFVPPLPTLEEVEGQIPAGLPQRCFEFNKK